MGSIQDEWASDASEILTEIPKSVTVRRGAGTQTAFQVLVSPPMIQQDLQTGGFMSSTSYDIKFKRTDTEAHAGVVIYGNLVRYNNGDFRIVAINDRPPSAWIIVKVQSKGEPA